MGYNVLDVVLNLSCMDVRLLTSVAVFVCQVAIRW